MFGYSGNKKVYRRDYLENYLILFYNTAVNLIHLCLSYSATQLSQSDYVLPHHSLVKDEILQHS